MSKSPKKVSKSPKKVSKSPKKVSNYPKKRVSLFFGKHENFCTEFEASECQKKNKYNSNGELRILRK